MKGIRAFALLLAGLTGLVRAGDGATIQRVSGGGCVFADQTATWRMALEDTAAYAGTVVWSLALGGGVVARHEQNMPIQPEAPAVLDVQVALPAVRAGVEVEGRLTVTLLNDQRQRRSEFTLPVWTFGRDPAAPQQQWVQDLDLRVFDPAGQTLQKLNDLGWPCQPVANLTALDTLGNATLIIGEGCSLRSQRGLMASALQAAQRGAHVVFLAPTDGEFTPPEAAAGAPGPTELRFHDAALAQVLDKRLDLPPYAGLRLTGSRVGALVTVDPMGGWCGVEVRWPNGGALLLTGYQLLETWEESPVPRYLLFKMLEYVNPKKEQEQ